MEQFKHTYRALTLSVIFFLTASGIGNLFAENQNAPLNIEELKALKASNPPFFRERVTEIKNQLKDDFVELKKHNPSQITHFRKEFQKERAKYWREKKKQFKESFEPYLSTQRNLLYRQLEFLEFRKPKEYADIMRQIEKNRPATIKELKDRNEKFDRAKQRLQERDQRIREMTKEREQEQVAIQRRNDIVNKLRAQNPDRATL